MALTRATQEKLNAYQQALADKQLNKQEIDQARLQKEYRDFASTPIYDENGERLTGTQIQALFYALRETNALNIKDPEQYKKEFTQRASKWLSSAGSHLEKLPAIKIENGKGAVESQTEKHPLLLDNISRKTINKFKDTEEYAQLSEAAENARSKYPDNVEAQKKEIKKTIEPFYGKVDKLPAWMDKPLQENKGGQFDSLATEGKVLPEIQTESQRMQAPPSALDMAKEFGRSLTGEAAVNAYGRAAAIERENVEDRKKLLQSQQEQADILKNRKARREKTSSDIADVRKQADLLNAQIDAVRSRPKTGAYQTAPELQSPQDFRDFMKDAYKVEDKINHPWLPEGINSIIKTKLKERELGPTIEADWQRHLDAMKQGSEKAYYPSKEVASDSSNELDKEQMISSRPETTMDQIKKSSGDLSDKQYELSPYAKSLREAYNRPIFNG